MKNKVELKKAIIISICLTIIWIMIFVILNLYQYKKYTYNFNVKIEGIISKVVEEYPDIEKIELMEILNNNKLENSEVLRDYGIDLEQDSIIIQNDSDFKKFRVLDTMIFVMLVVTLFAVFGRYNINKDKKLKEITQYIEEINRKNYKLNIDDNTEDELSILKNEIYKTTVMLKEQAENSINDKVNLKDSLSDISHQLKTPLTSIIIMLDNILDNPDMEQETRNDFIKNIRREITNINFLVHSLLKLSKLDSNTINFINKDVKIIDVVNEAVKNVSILCDLKDIEVMINGDEELIINCDIKWQVEALTNILKNAVEYSDNSSQVYINFDKNQLYSQIEVIDKGKGIAGKELPHIFERFYKGKNSSKDSIGIGLALAKSIVEKNNGTISIDSKINEGTKFIIKYF